MSNLYTELQRLYFLPDQQWLSQMLDVGGEPVYAVAGALTPEVVVKSLAGELGAALNLVSAGGGVRVMVVSFARAGDWEQVANLFQAVQEDLDLPAPALAVSGQDGFRLWFSLAEPVPVAQARAFLAGLQRKYLADIPVADLEIHPGAESPAVVELVPASHLATGKWSAFIDPGLGGMFVDEPGLEMAPNMDKQAHILAGLECIKAGELQRVLKLLQAPAEADAASSPGIDPAALPSAGSAGEAGRSRARLDVGTDFSDPQSFLLAVMNDPSASARQRIRAAKALLPYFARVTPQ